MRVPLSVREGIRLSREDHGVGVEGPPAHLELCLLGAHVLVLRLAEWRAFGDCVGHAVGPPKVEVDKHG